MQATGDAERGLRGIVHAVSGARASIGLPASSIAPSDDVYATVGKFIRIKRGSATLVGTIVDVTLEVTPLSREHGFLATARVDLMGEIRIGADGAEHFSRGVTHYPAIGDEATLLTSAELNLVYDLTGANAIEIGELHQDRSVRARIDVDNMLAKHFAVLGTTGVGKSSAIALILQQILEARPNVRVFLLDGHNEYGRCFGDRAQVLNPGNMRLPFWLFNFEEFADVLFGARTGLDEELAILSETIPIAKSMYAANRAASDRAILRRSDPKLSGYTVDTPVPYRLSDLVNLIDERMGRLENRSSRLIHYKLITRVETVRNDPRYGFMFESANVGGDTMADVLRQLFCLRPAGPAMTVMQLGGFPVEVVDSVVSVLCRMAFDLGLWSDGGAPLLFVCEEAHRYASADRATGFGPTRKAIARIAKEGRKYGIYLGLVTQRPAELDPTIISQCSTLLCMRMANDRDQALVRSAVSDAAANLLAFMPSLGPREMIAYGEGLPLPSRMILTKLAAHFIPRAEAVANIGGDATRVGEGDFLDQVVEKWRGAAMSARQKADNAESESPANERLQALQAALGNDLGRPTLRRQT